MKAWKNTHKNATVHGKWATWSISFYIAFGVLLLVPVSCNYETATSASQHEQFKVPPPVSFDLDKIRKRGSLVAIIDNSSTSYFIYRGQPMGYEYELLNLLAKELDVRLELLITTDVNDAIIKLNRGEGDLIAHSLPVTLEYKKHVAFTEHHNEVRQVLVQQKPDKWQELKAHEIDKMLIRNPLELEGKDVYVKKSSAYEARLRNLNEETGGDIIIHKMDDTDEETLIAQVAKGEIPYTIVDEDVARVSNIYYPNLDVNTAVSFPQKIAWATRKNAPELLQTVNEWILKMKKEADYYVIYNKYFKNPQASLRRLKSAYSTILDNGKISPYDALIQNAADELGWDWRLLAAQIYQESKFKTDAESWMGAVGLMQIMPATAETFGIEDRTNPGESIRAGVTYLIWLDMLWKKYIPDAQERVKYILASYNAGQGHVLDARRLARKYGKNPNKWENVADYLQQKSNPEFYNDPVVYSGYCRGDEPVTYVKEILSRYQRYKQLVITPNAEELIAQTASVAPAS